MTDNTLVEALRKPKICKDGVRRQPTKHARLAATRITALEAEKAELVHILEAITAMQALRYGDATRTHIALIGLCVTARATLAKHQEGEGNE